MYEMVEKVREGRTKKVYEGLIKIANDQIISIKIIKL
jgi:hypothetical protein